MPTPGSEPVMVPGCPVARRAQGRRVYRVPCLQSAQQGESTLLLSPSCRKGGSHNTSRSPLDASETTDSFMNPPLREQPLKRQTLGTPNARARTDPEDKGPGNGRLGCPEEPEVPRGHGDPWEWIRKAPQQVLLQPAVLWV